MTRYGLNHAQWQRIGAPSPGKTGDPGPSGADNRRFVNGVPWVLRSGAYWQDPPERRGKRKTIHKRLPCWAKAGVRLPCVTTGFYPPAESFFNAASSSPARYLAEIPDEPETHATGPAPGCHRVKQGAGRGARGSRIAFRSAVPGRIKTSALILGRPGVWPCFGTIADLFETGRIP